jgi:hypothetical protein
MKKNLPALLLLFLCFETHAQYLPLESLTNVPFYLPNPVQKQLLLLDNTIYEIRAGGLQGINVSDTSSTYAWINHYNLRKIVADTGGTYAYLRNSNDIGRFNPITQQYEIIPSDTLNNAYVNDIDISPSGKLWVVTGDEKIFVFDGNSWEVIASTGFPFVNLNDIRVFNDTLAYIRGNYDNFYRFHNGLVDSLYSIPSNMYYQDWDVDAAGNLWITTASKLLHVAGSNVTEYDASNTPLGTDQFINVEIGSNGNIWTAGHQSKLLHYDGTSWSENQLPSFYPIDDFILNADDQPVVVNGYTNTNYPNVHLDIFDGITWSTLPFNFQPFHDIRAISTYFVATEEGIFSSTVPSFYINNFADTSFGSYANEVTCFTVDVNPYSYWPQYSYGTHHGVQGLTGFDNSILPSQNINYIAYDDESYYIGTDSGLVFYNGTIYNIYNTQNSPLPSNKITYITISNNYTSADDLYIGTDNGLAIYQGSQWTVLDTTSVPIDHFYVTGILPYNQMYYDTATYITTLGSGLIRLFPSGGYELLNTSNGTFEDDSVYYITHAFLGKCGDWVMMGTKSHGVAYFEYSGGFGYDSMFYSSPTPITGSTLASSSGNGVIILADSILFWGTPCGAVEEITNAGSVNISWYQEGNTLVAIPPPYFKGKCTASLFDLYGRNISTTETTLADAENLHLDMGNKPAGTYLLRMISGNKSAMAKMVFVR